VSELSEALEGHRKDLMDDKLPHRKMVEVELVDFLIRAFDMAGGYGWDINTAGKAGLPNLTEYGEHYAHLYNIDADFADNKMRICAFLVRCWEAKYDEYRYLRMAVCTTLAVMSHYQMDIQGAFDEKMAYNARRKDHTLEHRAAEGGKKY
jgi:hypothetical protein